MPRVIAPEVKASLDWVIAGAMLAGAAYFWRRNRRAAVGLLVSGVTDMATIAMTDYPGGVVRKLDLGTHNKVAIQQSRLTATLPSALGIQGSPASFLFGARAVLAGLINGMTDYDNRRRRPRRERAA
ncbi:MAG: hypothetical protein EHM13_06335 [Acidobacteria bacterium]|nr:MAG: hypothetical protein EHM13_06335 [Acidobacteriota bacterium]